MSRRPQHGLPTPRWAQLAQGRAPDEFCSWLAAPLAKTDYGQYLLRILDEHGPRDWAGLLQ